MKDIYRGAQINRYAEIPGVYTGDECGRLSRRTSPAGDIQVSRGHSEKPRALARGGSFKEGL